MIERTGRPPGEADEAATVGEWIGSSGLADQSNQVDQKDQLKSLLEHVRRARGFDFTGYKAASLERRIKKRLDAVGLDSYAAYQDYLEANPAEFKALFDTILINVTAFFRDPEAWDYLRSEIVPILVERASDEQPIRVWSAACASGEEAYTIAMVLAEALGEDEFGRRVKIYATDIDDDALLAARQGQYQGDALEAVPEELRGRYWSASPGGFILRPDLRSFADR